MILRNGWLKFFSFRLDKRPKEGLKEPENLKWKKIDKSVFKNANGTPLKPLRGS